MGHPGPPLTSYLAATSNCAKVTVILRAGLPIKTHRLNACKKWLTAEASQSRRRIERGLFVSL